MTIFSGNHMKLDKNLLTELVSQPNSGVFQQQCKYHVALHPAQFNDFGKSIKDELGRKIAKYDESFKGIMLGYEKIKIQSNLGVIGPDNCYIHLDIHANFFVFRPEIGMILKGVVTRTTKEHVGCLVYNTFNISLPKPSEDGESWLGNNVNPKSEVEFRITYVDLNARIPYIRGEIRAVLSKGIESTPKAKNTKKKFDESNDMDIDASPKKKNKSKNRKSTEIVDEEADTTLNKPKKKSKKQSMSESVDVSLETEKPKKKSKKDKHKEKEIKQEDDDIKKEDDLNISLESLDLKTLFSSDIELEQNISQAADSSEKRSKRRRSQSQSQGLYLENVKLEEDSDLAKIIGIKKENADG